MSIFQTILRKITRHKAVSNFASFPADNFVANNYGCYVSAHTAMLAPTVYACVDFLSRTIAATPLITYQKTANDGKLPATNHPLYWLLSQQPNNWQTAFDYWLSNITDLCLHGVFISYKVKNAKGHIQRLIPLNPLTLRISQDRTGLLRFSGKGMFGDSQYFEFNEEPQSSFFFSYYRTLNGVTPASPIKYAAESTMFEHTALRRGNRVLDNSAVPPLIISYPEALPKDALENVAKQFRKESSGKNFGRPRFLDRDAKITRLDMSNEDAQYLESREFNSVAICGIFGVPPRMIGLNKQAKGWQTVGEEGQDFLRYNLHPWLTRILQSVYRDLLPESERTKIKFGFDVEHIIRPDSKTQVDLIRAASQYGALNPNEVREMLNRNHRKGGDSFARPMNMQIENETQKEGD